MKYISKTLTIAFAFLICSSYISGQVNESQGSEAGVSESQGNMADSLSGDIINVPFNTIDEQDLMGGTTVIRPDEFLNYDYTMSVSEGLNGRVGGLTGSNVIWGLGEALVLIDGVPRFISDVRLEEVDQISVMKGASASVLYGSHAANGVILITTKRGIEGEKKINVRVNAGLAQPKRYPEYLSSSEYMTLYNEARRNDGLDEFFTQEQINQHRNGNPYRYPDVDYYSDEYLKSSLYTTDVNADFSAGNEDARFYANVGWGSGTTLLDIGEGSNERDQGFNARGNVDLRINDFISSSIDVSTIISNNRRGIGNYWAEAASLQPHKYSPLIPISYIHPDSTDVRTLAGNSTNIIDGQYLLGGSQEYLTNPIADMLAGGYNSYISRMLQLTNTINFDLGNLVEGLSFHTLFSADYYNTYNQAINNDYAVYHPVWDSLPSSDMILDLEKFGNDIRTGTQNARNSAQTRNLGISAYFKYNRTLGEVHHLSGMLLASGNSWTYTRSYQPYTNANMGIQLAYNYLHRYWIDFSGSLNNSTRLPEGARAAFSPTLSFSWLLSEEGFLASAEAIDMLKLTLSGAMINTDNRIGDYYLYDNTYEPDMWFSWHDDLYRNRSTTSRQGSNGSFSFSTRKEVYATLSGSFFRNFLSLETSFFLTKMDKLPTRQFSEYPSYYSHFIPYTNYNANRYSGIDFMLNLNQNFGDVRLNVGLNGMYINSKVITRDELFTNDYQYREGKPVDAIFGLQSEGLFMDQADIDAHADQAFGEVQPGDIKYTDQNGDGVVDENDEVEIGKWNSPFYYGMHLAVAYKNFTLFAKFTGEMGGNAILSGNYYWVDGDDKYSAVVLDRWTGDGEAAGYPRLSSRTNNNNHRVSDYWMYDRNRLSVSKVQLTYELPARVFSGGTVKGLSIYLSGSNLLTISKNSDILDLNVGGAPQLRFFNAGMRASF